MNNAEILATLVTQDEDNQPPQKKKPRRTKKMSNIAPPKTGRIYIIAYKVTKHYSQYS
jgi:hypothetical protein